MYYNTRILQYSDTRKRGECMSEELKRLNADIPKQLYNDFAMECIKQGISKKDFIVKLLEEKLYGDQEEK